MSNVGARYVPEEFDVLDDSQTAVTTGNKPAFSIPTQFGEVLTISMNKEMADLLFNVCREIDGGVEQELWAMARALKDPEGCRRFRQQKTQRFR